LRKKKWLSPAADRAAQILVHRRLPFRRLTGEPGPGRLAQAGTSFGMEVADVAATCVRVVHTFTEAVFLPEMAPRRVIPVVWLESARSSRPRTRTSG
jgi:hypothetical protein